MKPFVENRVREIQCLSESETWAHCSGRDNLADILSRGQELGRLLENKLWWSGPSCLSEGADNSGKEEKDCEI